MSLLERAWVGLVNSSPIRGLRGSGPVQRLLRAGVLDRADDQRRRWIARVESNRHPGTFENLETVGLFVGHVKSGGTLLGAMIDAHPDAVMADDVDVLDFLARGYQRDELLHVLARNARREAMKGRVTARRLGPYSVAIPHQWQGRHRVVRVIGASRAGPTTRRLGTDRHHLERLRFFSRPARLRFVHMVRNPLDPIGAMVRRGQRSVEEACFDYAAQSARLDRIRSWLGPEELLTVHYEGLVAAPRHTISGVTDFLGLTSNSGHSAACAALVERGWPGERDLVDWSPSQLDRVRSVVESHSFLARYRDNIEIGSVEP